jgi:hypothetical protein
MPFIGLIVLAVFVLQIYCLIDVVTTDGAQVRNLPKVVWLLLVLFFALLGSVSWLLAGRPQGRPAGFGRPGALGAGGSGGRPPRPRRTTRPQPTARAVPPDDDPDFLRRLSADAEVRRRQEERRRRELGNGDAPVG